MCFFFLDTPGIPKQWWLFAIEKLDVASAHWEWFMSLFIEMFAYPSNFCFAQNGHALISPIQNCMLFALLGVTTMMLAMRMVASILHTVIPWLGFVPLWKPDSTCSGESCRAARADRIYLSAYIQPNSLNLFCMFSKTSSRSCVSQN